MIQPIHAYTEGLGLEYANNDGVPLDTLVLKRLDVLLVDVEGMLSMVEQGALAIEEAQRLVREARVGALVE